MITIDMAMPESCVECRFSQGGYMYCHAMPENFCGYVNYCEEDGRPEWCPLKAQEPVKPYTKRDGRTTFFLCGGCNKPLCIAKDIYKPKYCPECGREVKWE